jgi:hypothetical protein
MGRIFISAAHGGIENGIQDTGVVAGGTTEAREMILTRDLIVTELRSRNIDTFSVPDDLSAAQTIQWINSRIQPRDIAVEISLDAFSDPAVRGASVFYIANNSERKAQAEVLLLSLLRRLPQLPSRGVKPDTETGTGSLAFCRQLTQASMVMELGFLTNPDDRFLIQNRRRDVALGVADGLVAWSRAINSTPSSQTVPAINISINGQLYGEQGINLNGNAYIPIDLVDRLGIDLSKAPNIRRITYLGVVYVKAIELRDYNVSVGWDSATRTVVLRSILRICPGLIDRIMGHGNSSEVQLMMFLKSNNEAALAQFPDLPRLYREESTIEGINYDIAFCQMCVETNFLRFGTSSLNPSQNNFAGLGAAAGGRELATFPSARLGVRAQIQHLKAYASNEPLVQELVDPRFRFVTRAIAPLLDQLSGRWSADSQYGAKIMAVLRRLYESAGLL